MLTAIADLAQRFGGLEQRFGGLEQRFGGLEQQFGGLEQRFDELGQRVDGLASDVSRVKEETTRFRVDLMDRLDRQQDMLNSIRDDVGVNMAATDHVGKANLQTREDVQQLSTQVSLIHRRLIQLEARIDRQGRA